MDNYRIEILRDFVYNLNNIQIDNLIYEINSNKLHINFVNGVFGDLFNGILFSDFKRELLKIINEINQETYITLKLPEPNIQEVRELAIDLRNIWNPRDVYVEKQLIIRKIMNIINYFTSVHYKYYNILYNLIKPVTLIDGVEKVTRYIYNSFISLLKDPNTWCDKLDFMSQLVDLKYFYCFIEENDAIDILNNYGEERCFVMYFEQQSIKIAHVLNGYIEFKIFPIDFINHKFGIYNTIIELVRSDREIMYGIKKDMINY